MRFAYIDSQGKEVAIPSVDALQLRIELGAITGETMFFDGNTDKWAPANEHEIFRTLSRELQDQDEEGFVAPPPPTMVQARPPGAPEEEPEEAPEAEKEGAEPAAAPGEEEDAGDVAASAEAEPEVEVAEEPAAAEAPATETPSAEEPAKPKAPDPFAMEAGPSEEEAAPEPEAADDEDADLSDYGEIDLDAGAAAAASDLDEFGPLADPTAFGNLGSFDLVEPVGEDEEEEEEPAYESDESFDFGDFGDTAPKPAEAEAPEEEPESEEEGTPSFEFEGELEFEDTGFEEEDEEGEEEEDEGAEVGVGADVGPGSGEGAGLDLEAPLSEYSPDRPPSWMDEEEEEEGFDLAGYADEEEEEEPERPARRPARSSASRGGEEGDDDGSDDREGGEDRRSERPAPRARPERPRKKKSGMGSIVLGVVALAVLGGGGWFGWNYLQNRETAPVEEVVVIPELPANLEPTLDAAAAPAYQAAVDSLRALAADFPPAPDEDWLGGRYLANASDFDSIETYWQGFEGLIGTVRQREAEIFMAEFEARLDSLEVTGADRTALTERAEAGFRAARSDRAVVYDQLQTLVDAALDLHDFLLGNESAIEYSPSATGISADPVTEAVPASEALGEEMWSRVSDITRALDDLGALQERVGTERLLDIVFGRIRDIGIR